MSTETMPMGAVVRRLVMIGALTLLGAGLDPLAPAPVPALAAAQAVPSLSAGIDHSCAIESGRAYCWGQNYSGDLANSSVPVAVDTSGALAGRTIAQITVGDIYACAVDNTGAAYCWGYNGYGELGDDTTAGSKIPVAVNTSGALAGKTLLQVSAGGRSTCAVDAAGALYCWGSNAYGQLGANSPSVEKTVAVLAGPQPPASADAVPGGSTDTAYWIAPARLDGGRLTGYTATAAPGGAACTTAGARTCAITGLTNGTAYSITVVAHTTAGDSGASTRAIFTREPTGPIVAGDNNAKCIDDSNDSSANHAKVQMAACNDTAEQSWIIEPGGTIQINGKCMDLTRGGKADKTLVELWACTGAANQQWRPQDGALVNPVSGKCLDDPKSETANGTQLEIYTCNGGSNQQWELP